MIFVSFGVEKLDRGEGEREKEKKRKKRLKTNSRRAFAATTPCPACGLRSKHAFRSCGTRASPQRTRGCVFFPEASTGVRLCGVSIYPKQSKLFFINNVCYVRFFFFSCFFFFFVSRCEHMHTQKQEAKQAIYENVCYVRASFFYCFFLLFFCCCWLLFL